MDIKDIPRVDMAHLALDILALFPDGVPPDKMVLVKRIMSQLGHAVGIIGALQSTAGEVFLQHAQGNNDIAETFYEALLAISVPQI